MSDDDDRRIDEKIFRLLHEEVVGAYHADLIDRLIDRRSAELPDTFLPSARWIALANIALLFFADPMAFYKGTSRSKPGTKMGPDLFIRMDVKGYDLSVRKYSEDQDAWDQLWGIERESWRTDTHEVLAFAYGPTPIFFREAKAAMALAKHCHPNPRIEAQWLRWVPIGA